MTSTSRNVTAAAASAVILVTAACSVGSKALSAADPVFAGLDSAVVTEVLTNPTATQRRQGLGRAEDETMAQGMVFNFVYCRAGLNAYKSWMSNGIPPAAPVKPSASKPTAADADFATQYKQLASAIHDGDPSALRSMLTAESGCGSWVPAKPGDTSGPTVADATRLVK